MTNRFVSEHHPIRSLCYTATRNLYGDPIPELAVSRVEEELGHILRNGFAEPYLAAARIVDRASAAGYLTSPRGSVGSSFVAYLLGITDSNPLPPHYRCKQCKRIEWVADDVSGGFDLPNKLCSECGSECVGDGHRILFEMFLGIDGNTPPNIDLYVASEFKEEATKELNIHTDHHGSDKSLAIVDLVVHDELSIMKRLHTLTGVHPRDIPMNDPKVLSLFRSTGELGVTSDQIKAGVATYGIPEMGIRWVREMLEITQPSSFSELVQISGLSHGTGTWEGNARVRIQAGEGSLTTSIGSRDQLMLDLMDYGMEAETAFAIANSVRKGKGLSDLYCDAMLKCKVPDWYIESCRKIQYLFPKSFAISYVVRAIRNAFYKLYYPLEFYASYFTVRGRNLDMELCARGSEAIRKSLEEKKDDPIERFPLELALEMTARGLRIKKNIHSSNYEYVIESDRGSLEVTLKQES